MENNRERKIRTIPPKIRTEKRVAIYCRVSTTRDSQADSLEAQIFNIEDIDVFFF